MPIAASKLIRGGWNDSTVTWFDAGWLVLWDHATLSWSISWTFRWTLLFSIAPKAYTETYKWKEWVWLNPLTVSDWPIIYSLRISLWSLCGTSSTNTGALLPVEGPVLIWSMMMLIGMLLQLHLRNQRLWLRMRFRLQPLWTTLWPWWIPNLCLMARTTNLCLLMIPWMSQWMRRMRNFSLKILSLCFLKILSLCLMSLWFLKIRSLWSLMIRNLWLRLSLKIHRTRSQAWLWARSPSQPTAHVLFVARLALMSVRIRTRGHAVMSWIVKWIPNVMTFGRRSSGLGVVSPFKTKHV